jgi:selenocysteine-specific elongation factor
MEQLFVEAGLTTPTIKKVLSQFSDAPKQLVLDVLSVLVKENVITKVTGDLYFPTSALTELEKNITEYLDKEGEIDAPRFKELTGLTRKFSIPLLEYFDKIKLTLRVGDKRILRKKKK